MGGKNIKQKEI